ncbi:MAG: extracellular catalytic domain type 1 short-chain-length polyhydroxyalkanoate depolymerase [Actinomycetota bacterium]
MRRARTIVLATVVALSMALPAGADPKWKGTWERREYSNDAGTRAYMLYIPSKLKKDVPVLVYLHGCTQTAEDAALGTRFNALAEEEGFVVIYPEQAPEANGSRCWNWFLPEHQQRDLGEPSLIAGMTESVLEEVDGSRSHVFVSGASAGGAMSSIMGATYPDLYAAIGILAAPAYGGADATGDLAYAAMGEFARAMPTIIFQGTADSLVVYPAGRTALTQWLETNDLADNGSRDGSVSRVPEIENRAFEQQPSPGSGEPCVPPPPSFPCAGGVIGFQEQYPHTIESYAGGDGEVLVEFWSIHGLGHAYPGGDPEGSFTDPLGPDVTTSTFEFFMAHPMPESEPSG